jgi:YfiH family protein
VSDGSGWGDACAEARATLIRLPALAAIPGLVHGVSTRATGDLKTREGIERLAAGLGAPPASLVRGRQVHRANVLRVGAGADGGYVGCREEGADAIAADARGVVLLSMAADCVPLGLVDPEAGVVCAVHAGWRGAVSGIAGAAVRFCVRELGARAERLVAAIGPAIGPCCYEVGEEVVGACEGRPGASEAVWRSRDDTEARPRLDVPAIVRADLIAAGVRAERVSHDGACTRCDQERFFSYRGSGTTARFGLALGWRPDP